jgi:hypothetical protein
VTALKHQLTLDLALVEDVNKAIVVLERLRRWLELRPGLSITLTSSTTAGGKTAAAVAVGWSHEKAPPKLAGTWASVADIDRTTWPLYDALVQAARQFEAAERRGEAP